MNQIVIRYSTKKKPIGCIDDRGAEHSCEDCDTKPACNATPQIGTKIWQAKNLLKSTSKK